MDNLTVFTPVRGTDENIRKLGYNDGFIYFALDTKQIYIDANNKSKIPMGAAGSSGIFYGIKTLTNEEIDSSEVMFKLSTDIEGDILPGIDDLILNESDGAFYRVIAIDEELYEVKGARLTVAGGSGGSGGGLSSPITIDVEQLDVNKSTFIWGQESFLTLTPIAALLPSGTPKDTFLTLTWTVRIKDTDTYTTGKLDVIHNTPIQFDFGSKLYPDSFNQIEFTLEGANSGEMKNPAITIVKCVKMSLKEHTDFNSLKLYSDTFTMACTVEGNDLEKVLEYWVDNELVYTDNIASSDSNGRKSYTYSGATHGYHEVEIKLYQKLPNGEYGATVPSLKYEIACAVDGNDKPIIWIGNYKEVYNNYDQIIIPYLVYNPKSNINIVHFYKDDKELAISPTEIEFSTSSVKDFYKLEITDATIPDSKNGIGETADNIYSITTRGDSGQEVVRNINFKVLQAGKMTVKIPERIKIEFSASGRSNNESIMTKDTWSYTNFSGHEFIGSLDGFNWYNNGWMTDENNNNCLRISNGAKFIIPLGATIFNSNNQGDESQTFEFQFKVRNIQSYDHLIKLITRYNYIDSAAGINITDDNWYTLYNNSYSDEYESYDQFLQWYLNEELDGYSYDNLKFRTLESIVSTKNALCNYFDSNTNTGFCLGTQDAFFKTPQSTLNVNYVENRIINLSIVFSKSEKLVSIYLNGVLSGAAKITDNNAFTVNPENGYLIFNSDFCDIDLYKFRFYNTDLSIAEILNNYAVDLRDTLMYDQSVSLSKFNANTNEYYLDYNSMVTFNEEHPDNLLMPYFVFSNIDGDALPWSKAKSTIADFMFVNPTLDHLYETNEIEELAKGYPADNRLLFWIREMDTQGMIDTGKTSSNYYFELDGTKYYIDKELLTSNEFGGYKLKKSKKDDVTKSYTIPVYRVLNNIENYYLHHGASFIAQKVELSTQGTSSQYYPRRNFKPKCKELMWANRGPFKEDPLYMSYFYMDNDAVGTNKFTLKIDYMESSGSYNTGLANLVANAYTKHPLNDYDEAISGLDGLDLGVLRTSVQGFPALAFKQNADKTYTYIGRYNMNIDKGSDECYGYKLFENHDANKGKMKTAFVLDSDGEPMSIADAAECWEYSDNNRGYCSFRDPEGRSELSFLMNPVVGNEADAKAGYHTNAKGSCPAVADSFEYRYSTYGDMLDYIYDPTSFTTSDIEQLKEDFGVTDSELSSLEWRKDYLLDKMKNWEKVCKWVWSTNTENVDSESKVYETYAISNGQEFYGETAIKDLASNTSEAALLFITEKDENGEPITTQISDDAALNIIINDKGYTEEQIINSYGIINENNQKVLVANSIFQAYAAVTGFIHKETILVDGVNIGVFVEGEVKTRQGVMSEISSNPGQYATTRLSALESPYSVPGSNETYYFDSKEYRLTKFKNEFTQHFDKEYSLVYFIVTELLMCYDSRGKNCMMASWGPQTKGGNYIWYPVFYDIDTQLGINNTGIPSFEYFVNATQEGCFSTNDSVLWGNIFQCFFDELKGKYQELRTTVYNINDPDKKNRAPFAMNVDYATQTATDRIEAWYRCDPDICNSICMRGDRPLIAINFDEYYKYISIMNPAIGYQGQDGKIIVDNNGAFLYALQGDRSLSRQQFVTNRINFIDSWLTQGNYLEGTGKVIKFRTSANDPTSTSDCWVDSASNLNSSGIAVNGLEVNIPYYQIDSETGEIKYNEAGEPIKTKELDADLFIKLEPYQRSYVTLATDNAPLPSIEFTGEPVRVDFPSNVATGIKQSPQYAEQLLYVYGADYLKDIGDVSLLYPREFELKGATHLERILLGNDSNGYKNEKLKAPQFDAEVNSNGSGKPLLKEVVLTNVKIDGSTNETLHFQSAEKLEIFRALGMNLVGVNFADGVALHTLHLPRTIEFLSLKEARNLTSLIDSYETPTRDMFGNWQAQEGLYIEGLTDKENADVITKLNSIEIVGGSMGYNSYKLLNKLYSYKEKTSETLKITMTDVNWSPYIQLPKDAIYNNELSDYYFKDNDHYQLVHYDNYTEEDWRFQVTNGYIYLKDQDISDDDINNINNLEMLINLAVKNQYGNTADLNNSIPNITGNIFINNTEEDMIDESYLRNTFLTEYYPNLHIFVNNVKKAYSAKFINVNQNDNNIQDIIGVQKISVSEYEDGKTWFSNPYELYNATQDFYDFYGWSTEINNKDKVILSENWDAQIIDTDIYDYVFYAILDKHPYKITFYNDEEGTELLDTLEIPYGDYLIIPEKVPYKDDTSLDFNKTYAFQGYSTAIGGNIADVSKMKSLKDISFYPIFSDPISVYDNIHPEYFSVVSENTVLNGVVIELASVIRGKLTIPATLNEQAVVSIQAASDPEDSTLHNRQVENITHVFFAKNANGNANIKVIGNQAFFNAKKLEYIEFPEGLQEIGRMAFCMGFDFSQPAVFRSSSITPSTLTTIGQQAFQGAFASDVTSIEVGANVKTIGSNVFNARTGESTSTLQIIQFGDKDNESKLDFNYCSAPIIGGGDQSYTDYTVFFYTSKYNSESDASLLNSYLNPKFQESNNNVTIQIL